MKYEYITSTGNVAIEVDEQFYDLLVIADCEEYNSNRKHSRRQPISLENCEYEGEWFEDKGNPINDTEAAILWERASAALTELQRLCFGEACLNGRTQQSVADELGIRQQVVDRHIKAAKKKLKVLFEQ